MVRVRVSEWVPLLPPPATLRVRVRVWVTSPPQVILILILIRVRVIAYPPGPLTPPSPLTLTMPGSRTSSYWLGMAGMAGMGLDQVGMEAWVVRMTWVVEEGVGVEGMRLVVARMERPKEEAAAAATAPARPRRSLAGAPLLLRRRKIRAALTLMGRFMVKGRSRGRGSFLHLPQAFGISATS